MHSSKRLPKNLYTPLSLGYCMALRLAGEKGKVRGGGARPKPEAELQVRLAAGKENKRNSYFSPNFLLQAGCLYFCLLTKK